MMDNRKIDNLIHDNLIPIQQIFKTYEHLSQNPSFHFNREIFTKCVQKTQELIEIARELAKEVNSNG